MFFKTVLIFVTPFLIAHIKCGKYLIVHNIIYMIILNSINILRILLKNLLLSKISLAKPKK